MLIKLTFVALYQIVLQYEVKNNFLEFSWPDIFNNNVIYDIVRNFNIFKIIYSEFCYWKFLTEYNAYNA